MMDPETRRRVDASMRAYMATRKQRAIEASVEAADDSIGAPDAEAFEQELVRHGFKVVPVIEETRGHLDA